MTKYFKTTMVIRIPFEKIPAADRAEIKAEWEGLSKEFADDRLYPGATVELKVEEVEE